MRHSLLLATLLFVGCASNHAHKTSPTTPTTTKAQPKTQYRCAMVGQHRGQHVAVIVTKNCLADNMMTITVVVLSKNGHAAGTEANRWKNYYFGNKELFLLFRHHIKGNPMLVFGTRVPKKNELRWKNPPLE